MKEVTQPLSFAKGYVGPPTPPNQTGEGCPGWKNLRLENGGMALTSYYGYTRKLLTRLEDLERYATGDNTKRVVLFDASSVFGVMGIGLAVVDYSGAQRRVLNLRVHPNIQSTQIWDADSGAPWDSETNPILMMNYANADGVPQSRPKLYRMGHHEYPALNQMQGKTFIFDQLSVPAVFDGQTVRECGIRPPRLAPTLIAEIREGSMVEEAGSGFSASQEGVSVAGVNQAPWFWPNGDGVPYTQVTISDQHLILNSATGQGNLCQKNLAQPSDYYKDYHKRMQFYFRVDGLNTTLPSNTLSLLIANAQDLGGTVYEFPLWLPLVTNVWHLIDLPAPTIAESTFTITSVGFRLLQPVPDDLSGDYGQMRFSFGNIAETIPEPGPFTGKVMACFCWYDSKRNLRSDPSPYSTMLDLGDEQGMALRLDLGGYRGFYDTLNNGMANDVLSKNRLMNEQRPEYPDCDRILIYLSKPEWGVMADGSPVFRLVTTMPGIQVPDTLRGNDPFVLSLVSIGTDQEAKEANSFTLKLINDDTVNNQTVSVDGASYELAKDSGAGATYPIALELRVPRFGTAGLDFVQPAEGSFVAKWYVGKTGTVSINRAGFPGAGWTLVDDPHADVAMTEDMTALLHITLPE